MPGKTKKAKKKALPKNFEQMLEEGADLATLQAVFETCEIDARGGYAKRTALMMAECRDDLVRWLAANGADIAAIDEYGNTALHLRARSWRSNVGVLIELGSDVHAKTGSGETPLHSAADSKNANGVERLLAAGAEVDAKNREGLTPQELALRSCTNIYIEKMVLVARLLLAAGARKTPAARGFVKQIGQTFEFHRSNFNRDLVETTSAALADLCEIFEVEPPARRLMHDGTSTIQVRARTWQERHGELWNLLVPPSGPAATAQGEVIRISGRIAHEIDGNGGCNWDADYRKMGRTFLELIRSGTPLPEIQLRVGEQIVTALVKNGDGDTNRLAELAVAWVLLNLEPVRLGTVNYSR